MVAFFDKGVHIEQELFSGLSRRTEGFRVVARFLGKGYGLGLKL